jgi:hypothetical protein
MSGVTTYLDFGMTKNGKRTCYDYREGQNAYDLFMGARYLADMIAYRNGNPAHVYHPEDVRDQLRKYTALAVCRRLGHRLTYYEVGSSVLGVIDALNYLDQKYRELDTRDITWHGVDNSTFMNAMAKHTHENYDVHLSESVTPIKCDLFFAKGVSLLYAIDTEDLFCAVLEQSRIAVFDYTFAVEGVLREPVGTGLPVTYLNFEKIKQRLSASDKTLRLAPYTIRSYHQTPDRVTCDCLYGEPEIVQHYLEQMEKKSAGFEALWHRPLVRAAAP